MDHVASGTVPPAHAKGAFHRVRLRVLATSATMAATLACVPPGAWAKSHPPVPYSVRVHPGPRHVSAIQPAHTVPDPADDDIRPPAGFARAVARAAATVGFRPSFLLAVAWWESRFDPAARGTGRRSTTRGAFQFSNASWLAAVHAHGHRHGLGGLADRLDPENRRSLKPATVRRILSMRTDTGLSAAMAAETMRAERVSIREQTGREPSEADYFLVHVLGPDGAWNFLDALMHRPMASSFAVSGNSARRNPSLFAPDKAPLSVRDAYARIQEKLRKHMAMFADAEPAGAQVALAADR